MLCSVASCPSRSNKAGRRYQSLHLSVTDRRTLKLTSPVTRLFVRYLWSSSTSSFLSFFVVVLVRTKQYRITLRASRRLAQTLKLSWKVIIAGRTNNSSSAIRREMVPYTTRHVKLGTWMQQNSEAVTVTIMTVATTYCSSCWGEATELHLALNNKLYAPTVTVEWMRTSDNARVRASSSLSVRSLHAGCCVTGSGALIDCQPVEWRHVRTVRRVSASAVSACSSIAVSRYITAIAIVVDIIIIRPIIRGARRRAIGPPASL